MSVNYDFAEAVFIFEKISANPKQIVFQFLFERKARSNTGMNEKIIAANKECFEFAKKMFAKADGNCPRDSQTLRRQLR